MHRAKSSTAAERFHRPLHSYGTIQNVLFIQNFEPARRLNFGTVQAVSILVKNSFGAVWTHRIDALVSFLFQPPDVNVNANSYPHRAWYEGEGGLLMDPSPEFLICCSISKRFRLWWKAFDLLNKMRYILWVVALLEVCDITKNGRHLGFYQELEIKLKSR